MPALGDETAHGLSESDRWFLDRCDPLSMTSLQSGRLLAMRERASRNEALVIDALVAKIPASTPTATVERDVASSRTSMQAGRDAGREADVIDSRFDDLVGARHAGGRTRVVPRLSESRSPLDTLHVVGRDPDGNRP